MRLFIYVIGIAYLIAFLRNLYKIIQKVRFRDKVRNGKVVKLSETKSLNLADPYEFLKFLIVREGLIKGPERVLLEPSQRMLKCSRIISEQTAEANASFIEDERRELCKKIGKAIVLRLVPLAVSVSIILVVVLMHIQL